MNFKDYIKEKWYMFMLFFLCGTFTAAVAMLDNEKFIENKSFIYILSGIALFLIIFVLSDYLVLKTREKKLSSFIKNGGTEDIDVFYPVDRKYSEQINKLANEYNKFRAKAAEDSAEELDFITKWVHDVKVPISAMKLLLENDAQNLKEKLEMELSHIEQNTQKVLFHIKSKSFYDDYKISKASTKDLISTSLKQFATFFSYKKISLNLLGSDYTVLTDSKWSGYILSQFLSNAIKHTPENGEISIVTEKDDKGIAISVKNTGKGIEKRDLNQVYNRGYTASDRAQPKATGYGLFLSKKLADKLGHMIEAESEYGKYAKFSIIFLGSQNELM